jgi:hypothetical protein
MCNMSLIGPVHALYPHNFNCTFRFHFAPTPFPNPSTENRKRGRASRLKLGKGLKTLDALVLPHRENMKGEIGTGWRRMMAASLPRPFQWKRA